MKKNFVVFVEKESETESERNSMVITKKLTLQFLVFCVFLLVLRSFSRNRATAKFERDPAVSVFDFHYSMYKIPVVCYGCVVFFFFFFKKTNIVFSGNTSSGSIDIDLMQYMLPTSTANERSKQLDVKRAQFVQELLFSSLALK